MLKQIKNLALVFSIFFVMLWQASPVLSIGISPGQINVPELRNGVRVERIMYLVRDPKSAQKQETFSVSVSGDGAKYLEIPQKQIVMTVGQAMFPHSVFLTPVGAANGSYEATITYLSGDTIDGNKQGGMGSAIKLGATGIFRFTVVDKQIREFKIDSVSVQETEVGQPFFLSYLLINTGNVDAKPDKISIKLSDITDTTNVLDFEILPGDIEPVPPAATKQVDVSVMKDIPQGDYGVKISFYLEDKIIYEQEVKLRVYPAGTLAQSVEFGEFKLSGREFNVGDLIKMSSVLRNSGKIPTEAVLYVELSKDSKTLDILRSDKKFLNKNNQSEFVLTFRPESPGQYSADAYFEYGVLQTDKKSAEFTVLAPKVELVSSLIQYWWIVAILIAVALVIMFVVFMFRHKRKKAVVHKHNKPHRNHK